MAEEEPTTRDFLGRESPIAFRSQPALPAAGGAPVGASAAPAAPGGTGALVGGGGAAQKANAPSGALAEALRAIQLGGKFGDLAQRAFSDAPTSTGSAPATTGEDVPIDALGAGIDPGGTAGMSTS